MLIVRAFELVADLLERLISPPTDPETLRLCTTCRKQTRSVQERWCSVCGAHYGRGDWP